MTIDAVDNKDPNPEKPVEKKAETKKADPKDSYPEVRRKFETKYPKGVCTALFKAGAVPSIEACAKEAAPEAAEIAKKWETGWTSGMKKFLGIS